MSVFAKEPSISCLRVTDQYEDKHALIYGRFRIECITELA